MRRLMEIDPEKPGLVGLLRGEGESSLQAVAWLALLFVVFASAVGLFAVLSTV